MNGLPDQDAHKYTESDNWRLKVCSLYLYTNPFKSTCTELFTFECLFCSSTTVDSSAGPSQPLEVDTSQTSESHTLKAGNNTPKKGIKIDGNGNVFRVQPSMGFVAVSRGYDTCFGKGLVIGYADC